jgi:hypothetical protein
VREREAFHEQSDSTGRAIVAPIAPVDGTQNREPTAEVVTPSDAVGTAIDKAERELHGYTAPLSQERETAAKFLAMARDLLHRYGKDAAQQKLDAAMAVLGMEKP